jgi:hypothetical protein
MSSVARIDTIHRLFYTFAVLTLMSLFGLAVTGNAWYWVPFIASPFLAYRQTMKLPFDHPLRVYLRGRVDAWF